MTTQLPDTIRYGNTRFELTALSDGARIPATPRDFELEIDPDFADSMVMGGFLCLFAINGNQFLLKDLAVAIPPTQSETRIAGVAPRFSEGRLSIYQNLNLPLDFSGGILMGDNYIGPSIFMTADPVWFQDCHEIIVESGHITKNHDVSFHVQRFRNRFQKKPEQKDALLAELRNELMESYPRLDTVASFSSGVG